MRKRREQATGSQKEEGRLEGIRRMLDAVQEKIKNKDATVGDYVRLVALERELRGEELVREIRVTWVRPSGTESVT